MRVLTLAELSFVAGGDYGGGGDDGGDIVVTANPDNGGDDTGGDYDPGDYGNEGGDEGSGTGGGDGTTQQSSQDKLHQQEQGHYQLQGDISKYYYKDANGGLHLQPQYQQQIDNSHIDWAGVARDSATIIFGAIGGAGEAVLGAIAVVGGSGSMAAYEMHSSGSK